MQNATITVVLGVDARPNQLEALAREAQTQGAHLIVLLLSETPAVPVYSMGVGELSTYSLPAGWQADVDAAREAVEKQRAEFSQYLTDQGASADVRAVCGDASALRNTVARAGLTCDAVLIGTDLREDKRLFEDIVHAALFESAVPVLLNTAQTKVALTPQSVFVAWKAGIPATRAIRAALPILRNAREVTVALFDPVSISAYDGENPGTDVAAWLTHQGCNVAVQQYASGGADIGTAILKRAKETGADLIVMGAYDHSRLREMVFGGTTRSLIEQSAFPVLLSH
ncbi:universal stress protein [Sulfitobacter sp. 1A13191]|jgi:nucleotide-binding universal stress UspA family protein|uniref:universal stress protein n=1 Tax=unclassified Sulfitobacter TaxID=196795 RepID=UPI003745B6DF